MSVNVVLEGYVSGFFNSDNVSVTLYNADGAVESQSVSGNGTKSVTFSGIEQSGGYFVRLSADDNTSGWFGSENGDLQVDLTNLSYAAYTLVTTAETITVTAP